MSLNQAAREPAVIEGEPGSEQDLRISVLGEFVVRQGDRVIALETASYQLLLAFLIIHADQTHARQKLAFQFWPESTEAQARTNLRKALYRIRQTIPDVDRCLVVTRHTLQWLAEAPCDVDVRRFVMAAAQAQQADLPEDKAAYREAAVNAYHGDFLPGYYDEWVLAAREALHHQYLAFLEEQISLYENRQEYKRAIDLAGRRLREEPLHERAYRRLMQLQALDGDVAGALRTYYTCSTRLQRELGVDPSPATREAYERLLKAKTVPGPAAPARLPLVAREEAWQKLRSAWKRCSQGQAGVALISGEAGIGKTRLAEELLEWAERQGIVTLTAVCYPSEKRLAYAPVAKWLRSETVQPVFHRLGRRQLGECSRLLPELQEQRPDLPHPAPLTEPWQRQHLFSCLAQTFLQLRQPVLLFIDDLPWCDQDSLDWLHYLLQFAPQSRLMLLTCARSEDVTANHPLRPWQQALDGDGRLSKITLMRLDAGAAGRLAGYVVGKDLDSRQIDRLYTETEGNPLFVVEMARAGLETLFTTGQQAALSPKVQMVIETRLASLSPAAYQLTQLAAAIGRSFSFKLLNQACAQSEENVIRHLDEMWQRRIVREQGAEGYDFSHDKLRQVAYDSLSQARRRQMHKQLWRALETLHQDDRDAVSEQIGAHCEAAGYYREAIAAYQRAARAAQDVYANKDTLDFLQRAINLLPQATIDPEQQLELYEQQGDVLIIISRFEAAEAALAKAIPLIRDPLVQSRIFRKIATTRQLRRQHDQAFDAWQSAEESLGDRSDGWLQPYWQEWLWIQLERSWVLYWTNRLAELERLLKEIQPMMEAQGARFQQGLYYQRLVWLALRRDRFLLDDETVAYARASLATIEGSGTQHQVAFAQFVLGLSLYHHGWIGDYVEAEQHVKSALAQAEELGDVVLQIRCLIHLSQNYMRHGKLDAAKTTIPKALDLAQKANNLEYVLMGTGLESWYAWRTNAFISAQRLGAYALEMARDLPFGWPGKWIVALPLISMALTQHEEEKAIAYARLLLDPSQMRLRDELTAALAQAIDAWEDDQRQRARSRLEQALSLAQAYHYL